MDGQPILHLFAGLLFPDVDPDAVTVAKVDSDEYSLSHERRTWVLSVIATRTESEQRPPYELLEAREGNVPLGIPTQPGGYAVFGNGEIVSFASAEGLARFWQRLGVGADPRTLAAVIVDYAPRPDGVGPIQHLIATREAVHRHLTDEQLDSIDGFVELSVDRDGGGLNMRFCSYSVYQADDLSFRVGLTRWDVTVDSATGAIWFEARPVASGLKSLRYTYAE